MDILIAGEPWTLERRGQQEEEHRVEGRGRRPGQLLVNIKGETGQRVSCGCSPLLINIKLT